MFGTTLVILGGTDKSITSAKQLTVTYIMSPKGRKARLTSLVFELITKESEEILGKAFFRRCNDFISASTRACILIHF